MNTPASDPDEDLLPPVTTPEYMLALGAASRQLYDSVSYDEPPADWRALTDADAAASDENEP